MGEEEEVSERLRVEVRRQTEVLSDEWGMSQSCEWRVTTRVIRLTDRVSRTVGWSCGVCGVWAGVSSSVARCCCSSVRVAFSRSSGAAQRRVHNNEEEATRRRKEEEKRKQDAGKRHYHAVAYRFLSILLFLPSLSCRACPTSLLADRARRSVLQRPRASERLQQQPVHPVAHSRVVSGVITRRRA